MVFHAASETPFVATRSGNSQCIGFDLLRRPRGGSRNGLAEQTSTPEAGPGEAGRLPVRAAASRVG
jgi:hypothetical protein